MSPPLVGGCCAPLLISANSANPNFGRQKNFLRPQPKKLSFGTSITSSHLYHYPIYFQ